MEIAIFSTWIINAIILMYGFDVDSFVIAFFVSMFGSVLILPIVAIEVVFVNYIMNYFIQKAENVNRLN